MRARDDLLFLAEVPPLAQLSPRVSVELRNSAGSREPCQWGAWGGTAIFGAGPGLELPTMRHTAPREHGAFRCGVQVGVGLVHRGVAKKKKTGFLSCFQKAWCLLLSKAHNVMQNTTIMFQ